MHVSESHIGDEFIEPITKDGKFLRERLMETSSQCEAIDSLL
jgi:hypothetical protein